MNPDPPTPYDVPLTPDFLYAAQRTHDALAEMMAELNREMDSVGREKLPGMIAGCVAQAVEFYFNSGKLTGLSNESARAGLDRLVDDYWKQSVTGYITQTVRHAQRSNKGKGTLPGHG